MLHRHTQQEYTSPPRTDRHLLQTNATHTLSMLLDIRRLTQHKTNFEATAPDDTGRKRNLRSGDGSLAGAPAPHMRQKGIRPVLKVVDEKCL